MRVRTVTIAAACVLGTVVPMAAQSPADLVARGDAAYQKRRSADALDAYVRAIEIDASHYEALWKASRSEVDLAEVSAKGPEMDARLSAAQTHAEAAIRIRPDDAEGHFSLARALGRRALSAGVKEGIRLAAVIRDEANAALKANPAHPGALHVLGMWHAEIMRINGMSRIIARAFLGARIFGDASWDEAQRLLEAAVAIDPGRIVHRLDLAGIYADRGDQDRAQELYESVASAPLVEPNDDLYRRQAKERLKAL